MKKCAVCAKPSETWAHLECILIMQHLVANSREGQDAENMV